MTTGHGGNRLQMSPVKMGLVRDYCLNKKPESTDSGFHIIYRVYYWVTIQGWYEYPDMVGNPEKPDAPPLA